jgi:AcrR family transcriptional regulator
MNSQNVTTERPLDENTSARRQEVLQTAAECFAQAGYRGASMRTIAEALGMRAGSLYSHFKSKQQMLEELVNSFFDELLPRQRAAFEVDAPVAERLSMMVDEVVSVCAAHREVVMVIELDWDEISRTPPLQHIVEKGRDTSMLFRELLEEGMAGGEIRDDMNSDSVVRLIYSAIYGLLDRRFRQTGKAGQQVNNFSREEVATTLKTLLITGIVIPPAPRN